MRNFSENISISATPVEIWAVLADIGYICLLNPGVADSKQTSSGKVRVGETRYCDLNGRNFLNEEVVLFEPCHRMTIRIADTNLSTTVYY
jgi:hypothetical protein